MLLIWGEIEVRDFGESEFRLLPLFESGLRFLASTMHSYTPSSHRVGVTIAKSHNAKIQPIAAWQEITL